ncbi:MAG: hypothetical protein M3Q50_12215 [Chloroflexota bacterium]|nr:hypothetical protein [Chloroflexota bacterium]
MGGLARAVLRPLFVFLLAAIVVAALIVGIGTLLLRLHPEEIISEITRPDLLAALGLSIVVLAAGAVLSRPPRAAGKLDAPVAIGETPFFAPVAPLPTDEEATRRGSEGTWADILPGYILYARNGALAKVVALLPAEEEYGKTRRGVLYASGLYGANDEMWIPIEAVYVVYPETQSAFLAAKGDEIEHFGWNLPPQSFRRGPGDHAPLSSF